MPQPPPTHPRHRRRGAVPVAAAALLLLLLHTTCMRPAAAQPLPLPDSCSQAVASVEGMDMTPTAPPDYGKCIDVERRYFTTSNWCLAPGFKSWPGPPPAQARACLKFGRMTVFTGPIMGKDDQHQGACGVTLVGSDSHALVAVSTKYLSSKQGAWEPAPGACGHCMCVRVAGADIAYNEGPDLTNVQKYSGVAFMARVGDRCAECEDDHIDLLLDRPVAYAPYDPSKYDDPNNVTITNRHAPLVNRMLGLRGFAAPSMLRGGPNSPESVGVYTADWQWAPCEWTHGTCGAMFELLGYKGKVSMPQISRGINSDTTAYILKPEDDTSYKYAFEGVMPPDGAPDRATLEALIAPPPGGVPVSADGTATGTTTATGSPTPPMDSGPFAGGAAGNALRPTTLLQSVSQREKLLAAGTSSSPAGSNAAVPTGGAAGLSTGAIIGIAIGVGIPVLALAAFLTSRVAGGRKAAPAAAAGGGGSTSTAAAAAGASGTPRAGTAAAAAAAAALVGVPLSAVPEDLEGGGGVVRGSGSRVGSGSGAVTHRAGSGGGGEGGWWGQWGAAHFAQGWRRAAGRRALAARRVTVF